jgi:hypothetical protein
MHHVSRITNHESRITYHESRLRESRISYRVTRITFPWLANTSGLLPFLYCPIGNCFL